MLCQGLIGIRRWQLLSWNLDVCLWGMPPGLRAVSRPAFGRAGRGRPAQTWGSAPQNKKHNSGRSDEQPRDYQRPTPECVERAKEFGKENRGYAEKRYAAKDPVAQTAIVRLRPWAQKI